MPNVKSIPPGAPFLSVLVDGLLSGDLVHGFRPDQDPLALARVTIWLPTRRAVRELSGEFVSRLNTGSTLLPDIRALGDFEDDDVISPGPIGDERQPVGSIDRQLILGQLIYAWASNLNESQRSLYEGADILMPSSVGDAVWFASDLARLMDTVATEEADWSLLSNLVPDNLTDWWQLTLEFLKISTKTWPMYLEERGLCDVSEYRIQSIRRQIQMYKNHGSRGPVIAAGSTGSIPATAELLRTIANLEQGLVVLPGLDRDLDPETWAKIDLPDNERDDFGSAPGHPQFGLKRLLDFIQVSHGDVHHIGWAEDDTSGSSRVREHLISAAMRPSFSTELWQDFLKLYSDKQRQEALLNVALVEAPSERHEAIAIAMALREVLEDTTKTAALVTPDRNLARRVAVELERFGLEADDSAGSGLRNSQQGQLLQLVVQVAFAPAAPLALVSLLKHPLAHFGLSPDRKDRAAQALELALFRDTDGSFEPTELPSRLADVRRNVEDKKAHIHRSVALLNAADWDLATILCDRLADIFKTENITEADAKYLARSTVEKLEACGRSEDDRLDHVYDQAFGWALYQFLAELLETDSTLDQPLIQWPSIVDALLSNRMVRTEGRTHPRLAILGPLEARLQQFDRVVLGGLNEKVWPATTRNDPFLSRPQKAELSLPPPERRTGLAAHDFQMLMGINDVVLTRAQKLDDAPSVASRWVQRLCLLAGEPTVVAMRENGKRFLDWVDQIDQPDQPVRSIGQPTPCPPVIDRPTSLSITEIQSWIEDPYVIYARHVLKLTALGPVMYQSGNRERGTLYHEILETYSRSQSDSLDQLLEIARDKFDHSRLRADQRNLWWVRFQEVAKDFVTWDGERQKQISQSFIEAYGKLSLDKGFVLRGKADRVDWMLSGGVDIIDYKTGKKPTKESVHNLDSPQLPLEAAMVVAGAFNGIQPLNVEDLTYVRLRPNGEFSANPVSSVRNAKPAQQLAQDAVDKLNEQIVAYQDPGKAYVSKARAIRDEPWQSDYDHLARVREWSIAGEGDQE